METRDDLLEAASSEGVPSLLLYGAMHHIQPNAQELIHNTKQRETNVKTRIRRAYIVENM